MESSLNRIECQAR